MVPEQAATLEAIDTNKDGKISKNEFVAYYKDVLKSDRPRGDREVVEDLDGDKSGELSVKEYLTPLKARSLPRRLAFSRSSTDGDGKISKEEPATTTSTC